jgi:hypothetical protein
MWPGSLDLRLFVVGFCSWLFAFGLSYLDFCPGHWNPLTYAQFSPHRLSPQKAKQLKRKPKSTPTPKNLTSKEVSYIAANLG